MAISKISVKKKHLQVVNVLKQSVEITNITKRILNLRVNLTIDKLLASMPAIEKRFIQIIFQNKAI